MNIFRLSYKNLKRKLVRTAILLATVMVVIGTLFSATLFILSMQNALKIGTYRLGADVMVVPEKYASQAKAILLSGEPNIFYMDASLVDKVRQVEGVKSASPQLFIRPASFSCCYNVDVFLVAFDPKTDFIIKPWLVSHLKSPITDNEIITGREIPVITGDSIPFFGTLFRVAGTMEPTGMKLFDTSVFMTMDAAYEMAKDSAVKSPVHLDIAKDKVSAVLVQVTDDFTPERVAIRLEHDIPGIKAITSDEVISIVRKQLNGLLKGIVIISAVLWVVILLMMSFAFSMIVNERRREIGLLRAMGAKKSHIFKLIISESTVISTLGGLLGLIFGSILIASIRSFITHALKVPYLIPSPIVLALLIVTAIIFSQITGFLSALIPAVSASRMEPYEAIRSGE
jgi:putative ABC transport system permease protein